MATLLKYVIPVCQIRAGTIEGESGMTHFFSLFEDVTDPKMLPRARTLVLAEYVALREIFLCKDRSFNAKEGYNYPLRAPGVNGHNMDWILLDPDKDEVRAVHYDFEQFYTFLKWMAEMWVAPQSDERKARLEVHIAARFAEYESRFGNRDFFGPLTDLLLSMQAKFTIDYVRESVKVVVAQQELPDPEILRDALQGKIRFYLELIKKIKDQSASKS